MATCEIRLQCLWRGMFFGGSFLCLLKAPLLLFVKVTWYPASGGQFKNITCMRLLINRILVVSCALCPNPARVFILDFVMNLLACNADSSRNHIKMITVKKSLSSH